MVWKERNISTQETNIHSPEHHRINVRVAYLRFILPGFSMENEGGELSLTLVSIRVSLQSREKNMGSKKREAS